MTAHFEPGYIYNEKYRVEDRIGRGGYGTVLRVVDLEDNTPYALKCCVATEEDDRRRFTRELDILEEKRFENVIQVIDSDLSHSPPYYVMQLADGSLYERISDFGEDQKTIIELFLKICTGVNALHSAHCYHRDLKPQNILLINGIPHIADFGCAKMRSMFSQEYTQAALGTAEYAPPEQFTDDGSRDADARSDIFSLGKLLYWMITKKSPSTITIKNLPDRLGAIVQQAVEHNKAERYQSVESFMEVIGFYLKTLEFDSETSVPINQKPNLEVGLRNVVTTIQRTRSVSLESSISRGLRQHFEDLMKLNPKFENSSTDDEKLLEALDATISLMETFSVFCELIGSKANRDLILPFSDTFGVWIEGYFPSPNVPSFRDYYFDYVKFLGHEMYVMLSASLIAHRNWAGLVSLLGEGAVVKNGRNYRADFIQYTAFSQYIQLLEHRNRRLELRRLSLHSDILMERHTRGGLADTSPLANVTDADFFLFLYSLRRTEDSSLETAWRPWSVVHAPAVPDFLHRAISRANAAELASTLGQTDVPALVNLLRKNVQLVEQFFSRGSWFHPARFFEFNEIGTK